MGVEKINLGNLKPEVLLRIFTSLLLSVYILMVQKKHPRETSGMPYMILSLN